MIKRPRALWDEYYKNEAKLMKERGGPDKLTPEDRAELERAQRYVLFILDEEEI